jgi:beta-glucanase (GH16 family)
MLAFPAGAAAASSWPWRLVFDESFSTDAPEGQFLNVYGSRWWAYPSTWHDTTGHGTYDPNRISVANGVMRMRIGGGHVAAPVPKVGPAPTYGRLYGRYVVRFRADPVRGYKTAWLLWPDSESWPADGEVDWPEGNLDGTMSAFLHHRGATLGSDQEEFKTSARYSDWHTAVTEWTPGRVRFLLDGNVIGESTTRVPDTPMHWVLQTETSTDGTIPDPAAQSIVQVDWVRALAPQ